MSKYPPASRDDHERFCHTEHWEAVASATGGNVKHHDTYKLVLPGNRVLRTRISRPVNRTTYAASMWGHILRCQLDVDNAQFWSCVRDGILPPRGMEVDVPDGPSLPLHLAMAFERFGVAPEVYLRYTEDEAHAKLAGLYEGHGR